MTTTKPTPTPQAVQDDQAFGEEFTRVAREAALRSMPPDRIAHINIQKPSVLRPYTPPTRSPICYRR